MSSAAVTAGPSAGGRPVAAAPVRSLVPALAGQEARRLLLHPLSLLGFGFYVVATVSAVVSDHGPRSAFETASMVLTFFPGVPLILAANLVATRDRRAGAEEILAPVPARQEERVKAIAVASLAPALVGLLLTVALHGFHLQAGRYAADGVPGLWHLLGGPVTLTGACLYGLMLGVWSRARVTPVVGVLAIVVANTWVNNRESLQLLGPAFGWARWGLYAEDWAGVFEGSPFWHVVYLAALGALAFAAAWVRTAARRGPIVVLGLLCLAATVAAALLQMPAAGR